MNNEQIKRMASNIIEQANAQIHALPMDKGGWMRLGDARKRDRLEGQIAAANAFLDAVACEESFAVILKAKAA